MYHVDNSTGVPVMPQPSSVTSETELFFTEGGNGVPPTYPGPDWFNTIQSELLNILRDAGLDPDKMDNTQILAALKKLFLSRSNPFGDIKADGAAAIATALSNLGFGYRLLEANGYFELPGGFLLQWGSGSVQATNATVRFKKPFNVTPFIVLPHKITADNRYVTSVNYTLTGFSLYGWNGGGVAAYIDSYTYLALGM
ncbi:gp53-like domain-containing protein [Citrobacter sp. RHBSTW-00325]|uniref:gp53-like domain-containing protein n=1 Tax=Citrobacter sp. RHBSTW-00325 TaxID=2742644 RepID=UPI0020170688|nr:hypothetical protein [Citrobacter sp. RHBSTW-00325]